MDISPADAPLEARFQLNKDDVKASQALAKQGTNALTLQRLVRALLALFALVFVASVVFHRMLASRAATPGESEIIGAGLDKIFALLIPIGLFMVIWGLLMLKSKNALSKNPMLREPTLITLEENALTRHCGAFFNRIEWHGIARVIASDAHLILMISPTEGFIVPRRAFDSGADWQRFIDFARQQWQRAQPIVPPIAIA